jgi:hypothetical protein
MGISLGEKFYRVSWGWWTNSLELTSYRYVSTVPAPLFGGPRRQLEQRPILGAGERRIEPAAKLLLGNFTGPDFGEQDPTEQDLAARIGFAFSLRFDRSLACLQALLPRCKLNELILQRYDLIVDFGHRRNPP